MMKLITETQTATRQSLGHVVALAVGAKDIVGLKSVQITVVVVVKHPHPVLGVVESAASGVLKVDGVAICIPLVVVL